MTDCGGYVLCMRACDGDDCAGRCSHMRWAQAVSARSGPLLTVAAFLAFAVISAHLHIGISAMTGPMRVQNKAPKISKKDIVKLDMISVRRLDSGWRDVDNTRVSELATMFYAGQWGMNVFADVCLLKCSDMDGKRCVDDGLHTVSALKTMAEAFAANPEKTPAGELWPENIVQIIEEGLPVTVHEYVEDVDLDLREAWNAERKRAFLLSLLLFTERE